MFGIQNPLSRGKKLGVGVREELALRLKSKWRRLISIVTIKEIEKHNGNCSSFCIFNETVETYGA